MAGRNPSRVKLTYDDYRRIPDDGMRHEILDGEHHVSPAPRRRHQGVLLELAVQLRNQLGQTGLVYFAPTDLHLSEVDVLQPDLLVVTPDHLDRLGPDKVDGAPALVVEVLSPSTEALDRGPKMRRYAAGGVPEYWLVDPDRRRVEQYRLEGGKYRLDRAPERTIHRRAFPELCIDLDRLW